MIYAGARDLPGASRGVGGPASLRFPAVQVTCQTQAECDQKLADIEAFRDLARGRGQPGAVGSVQTDVAPSFGSISFDNNTDWHFGTTGSGIQPNQVDFISVAVHELAHVLGFGITRTNSTTSWANLTSTGTFRGSSVLAAYEGSGYPPAEPEHWGRAVVVRGQVDGQGIVQRSAGATNHQVRGVRASVFVNR